MYACKDFCVKAYSVSKVQDKNANPALEVALKRNDDTSSVVSECLLFLLYEKRESLSAYYSQLMAIRLLSLH